MTPHEKALRHTVTPSAGLNAFLVTSGTSGVTYTVHPLPGGGALCSCKWGKRAATHDGSTTMGPCSHLLAVREFARQVLQDPALPKDEPEEPLRDRNGRTLAEAMAGPTPICDSWEGRMVVAHEDTQE